MQDITIKAVEGGAHVSIPRELNASFKAAFPRARWVNNASAWAVAGVLAERRASRWAADVRAEAERAAAELTGVPVPLDGRAYLDALKAEGRRMSTTNVAIKMVGEELRVTCAYHETIPPALRRLGGRWDAAARVWMVPLSQARALHPVVDAAEAALAPLAAIEAKRRAAQQAEWDREHAAKQHSRDDARRAAEAGSQWWIVGTEPALGCPFDYQGHRVVAVGHGERRRIDTDAIGVNGGSHDLDVHPCVRVYLRDATPEDEAAERDRRSAAAVQHRANEAERACLAAERRIEVERVADALDAGEVVTVTTLSGSSIAVRADPGLYSYMILRARVERDGADAYDGGIDKAYPLLAGTEAARQHHAALLAMGATHSARLGDWARLALSADQAQLLDRAVDAAEVIARRRMAAADAEAGAVIRASGADVRLVLTDDWAGVVQVTEAWVPASGRHEGYADHIRYQMRDADTVALASRCPSLSTVKLHSERWGTMPGSNTYVWVITTQDRDLLIRESRAIEAIRRAQDVLDRHRPLTPDDLRAVEQMGRVIVYEAEAEEGR